jgi:GNAT superfamily N-acetyltransferase
MPEFAQNELLIREITAEDAAATARLTEELGYPVSPEIMTQRIESLNRFSDHVVYVVCLSGKVVGWIDVRETHHLQAEPRAEIGGLVVSSEVRGRGLGNRLIECAEHWARQRGLRNVVVRSRVAREGAHRFYLRQGYKQTKTSAVFMKDLS